MLPLVRASRAVDFDGAEEELEAIYGVFKGLLQTPLDRLAPSPAPLAATIPPPHQVLALPAALTDWYASRRGEKYAARTVEDELQLHEIVVKLYKLRVPTYLLEQPDPRMRLFMPVEVGLRREFAQGMEAVRDHFVAVASEALSRVVFEFFGSPASGSASSGGHLCAVLDASGQSFATGSWRLALRFVFPYIVVAADLALKARTRFIHHLCEACRQLRNEPLAAALDLHALPALAQAFAPEGVDPSADAGDGLGASGVEEDQRLWAQAVDGRGYFRNSQHAIVWCDRLDKHLNAPEEKPLRPHSLCEAFKTAGSIVVKRLKWPRELDEAAWIRLGSVRTAATKVTDVIPPPQSKQRLHNGWIKYWDDRSGKFYYHHEHRQETTWDEPADAFQAPPVAAPVPVSPNYASVGAPSSQPQQLPQQRVMPAPVQQRLVAQQPTVGNYQGPVWDAFLDRDSQRRYYHLAAENRTVWEWDLPEGAQYVKRF